ncbi:restriction endonuclease subunit S [Luteimonas sp. A501]
MSLPRYPKYKDSGVDWIGSVPAHWQVQPLKRGYAVVGGSTPKSDVPAYWNGDIDWVTPADLSRLSGFEIRGSLRRITEVGLESCGTSLVPPGSLILSTRAPIGSLGLAISHVCTNQGCKALVPQADQRSRFVAYALSIAGTALNVRGKGTTFLELSRDELGNFPLALPEASEQDAVIAFLDRETARIDALIAEQEKLLALLAEKRQATISHAVTRSLDPNVPMKDSGIAWLGEVPAHWAVKRLRLVAAVQTGIAKGKDMADKSTIRVPYLRVANVQDGYLALSDIAEIDIEPEQLTRYRLKPGDVLMNEGGDFDKLGRGAIWNGEVENCIHQNHVFAVRPHGASPEWLTLVIGSAYAQFYFKGRSKQSTNLASISSTNVMELPVVLPTAEERGVIVEFVRDSVAGIEALTAAARRAVDTLRERRNAMICAVVTGQVDVRGLA